MSASKPPNLAPVYVSLYPGLAQVARKHGYALAVHGSAGRDFDLIAVPWVSAPSAPDVLIEAITTTYAFKRTDSEPTVKSHRRLCWTLVVTFGECFLDFSVMQPLREELTQ